MTHGRDRHHRPSSSAPGIDQRGARPTGREKRGSEPAALLGVYYSIDVLPDFVFIPCGLCAFGRAERYAQRTGKLKRVG